MRFLFIIILLEGLSLSITAQNNLILKDSVVLKESKIEQIMHLRNLLIDAVVEEDHNEIVSIKNKLVHVCGDNYIGLNYYEDVMSNYLTYNLEVILRLIVKIDSLTNLNYSDSIIKVQPNPDQLKSVLYHRLVNNKETIHDSINKSDLSQEEIDILRIYFILIIGETDPFMTQDSINELSKKYLTSYPNSKYCEFIKKYSIVEYEESNWGVGLDFFTGFGFFDGKLGQSYGSIIPFGVAFEFQYKSVILYLRDYIGFSRTKRDISFEEDTWKKGETALIFIPEVSIGYEIFNGKRIKISPFVGIAAMSISPTFNKLDDEKYDKINSDFRSTPSAGMNMDIKLKQIFNFVSNRKPENSYRILKFRYTYHNPNYSSIFSGGLHSFVIGYGGFGRAQNKVKY